MDVINNTVKNAIQHIFWSFQTSIYNQSGVIIFTNMNPAGIVIICQVLNYIKMYNQGCQVLIVVGEGDDYIIQHKIKQLDDILLIYKRSIYYKIIGGMNDIKNSCIKKTKYDYPVNDIDNYFTHDPTKPLKWSDSKYKIESFMELHTDPLIIYIKQAQELVDLMDLWSKYNANFHIYTGFYFNKLTGDSILKKYLITLINDMNLNITLYDYQQIVNLSDNLVDNNHRIFDRIPYKAKSTIKTYNNIRLIRNINLVNEYKKIKEIMESTDNSKDDNSSDSQFDECLLEIIAFEYSIKQIKPSMYVSYNDKMKELITSIQTRISELYDKYNTIIDKQYLEILSNFKRKIDDYNIIVNTSGLFYFNLESLVNLSVYPNKIDKLFIKCRMEIIDDIVTYVENPHSKTKILKGFNYEGFDKLNAYLLKTA